MPAKSASQQRFMGREYAKVKAGGRSSTGMSINQLRDFASTSTHGLPDRVKPKTAKGYGKGPLA